MGREELSFGIFVAPKPPAITHVVCPRGGGNGGSLGLFIVYCTVTLYCTLYEVLYCAVSVAVAPIETHSAAPIPKPRAQAAGAAPNPRSESQAPGPYSRPYALALAPGPGPRPRPQTTPLKP